MKIGIGTNITIFVRSGNIFFDGYIYYSGSDGHSWSSHASSGASFHSVNFLHFVSPYGNPVSSGYRSYGFPLRCLVR